MVGVEVKVEGVGGFLNDLVVLLVSLISGDVADGDASLNASSDDDADRRRCVVVAANRPKTKCSGLDGIIVVETSKTTDITIIIIEVLLLVLVLVLVLVLFLLELWYGWFVIVVAAVVVVEPSGIIIFIVVIIVTVCFRVWVVNCLCINSKEETRLACTHVQWAGLMVVIFIPFHLVVAFFLLFASQKVTRRRGFLKQLGPIVGSVPSLATCALSAKHLMS